MNYCKDARQLLGIKTICGDKCPIFANCPRLIMEDANDKAIEKAIESLIRMKNDKK